VIAAMGQRSSPVDAIGWNQARLQEIRKCVRYTFCHARRAGIQV